MLSVPPNGPLIKQNNGFINVYSELGMGTQFVIYLPRYGGAQEPVVVEDAKQPPLGKETILTMTKVMLSKQSYQVLPANSPNEAIRLAKDKANHIDLLITDVVMPEMNGRDLANSLQKQYPNLKCLFMSGYTADVIAHHGVLDNGVHFIQKPFSLINLAVTVRDVLDSK